MTSSVVQFCIEESTKERATNICEKLGIDLPTYLRICITRLVQGDGIPFGMKLDDNDYGKVLIKAKVNNER